MKAVTLPSLALPMRMPVLIESPALKTLYGVIRHFDRAGEVRHAPAESRPREETLNPKNWSHHIRASRRQTCTARHSPTPAAPDRRNEPAGHCQQSGAEPAKRLAAE
jgi:hypothetical protein